MSFLVRNVALGKPLRMSSWRKVSVGSWRPTGDSSVHTIMTFDAEPALAYIEKVRQQSGARVTLSHLVVRAVGEMMKRDPELNCLVRWGKLYPRRQVDVFLHVATDAKGEDLSGVTLRNVGARSLAEIAQEADRRVKSVRANQDPTFRKIKGLMSRVPALFSRLVIDLSAFILYTLNLWSPLLGAPRDGFGSAMVTNVGSLGLEMAITPIAPYTRVPVVFALGKVHEAPIAENGKLRAARVFILSATFDHRVIDGVHGARMVETLRRVFSQPEAELGG